MIGRVRGKDSGDAGSRTQHGIWAPFRSLILAQAFAAVFGLLFWVVVARLVDAHEVGVAAASISAQALLGLVTVLGFSTMLISELPRESPVRQRTMVTRSLLVVLASSALAGGVMEAAHRLLPPNLDEALDNPVGGAMFVLGTAASAWALVVDDACLAIKRSAVQVARNLFASGIRFPVTLLVLSLGVQDARALQVCWVLPLVISVPFALWRLRLPRGDVDRPKLISDVRGMMPLALRNHGLSLSLAAGSQMVPVVAAITLSSVQNAEFAIAWLMATFVFLPPYLLATALFAHGATVTTEEFRSGMERTVPAALSLSFLLCVGAWVLGEPVLWIFGGDYAQHSWAILALLVPAGLWMVIKDHLVVLWRSQRRFALATRLAGGALILEVAGATAGGMIGGARGLCIGWLSAMGVEAVLGIPWMRQAFGGLHWKWRPAQWRRTETGSAKVQVLVGALVVMVMVAVGIWSFNREAENGRGPVSTPSPTSSQSSEPPVDPCGPASGESGPLIDLNVQSATGNPARPIRSEEEVAHLVSLAQDAGARIISTSTSFTTMQPKSTEPMQFGYLDRTIAAARAAGMPVRLQVMGMPRWGLDDPQKTRQPPRSDAELEVWRDLLTTLVEHVKGDVEYLEIWSEPNGTKWWPTGPDPMEFARLLSVSYEVVSEIAPEIQVVSGGIAGNDIGYLERVYEAFAELDLEKTPFDMLGAHPFSGDLPPESEDPALRYEREPFGRYDEQFSGFTALHEVMADNGDDLPVYISQFGYSTKGADDRDAVPDELRAEYLTRALELASCAHYVPVFSWYALHPTRWDPPAYTLLDHEYRPNLTYEALAEWGRQVTQAETGQ